MPIEFDCPQCRNRLRTPDGTEGRTAQCPNCSAHVQIPTSSSAGSETGPAEPSYESQAADPTAAAGAFNPYSSPHADTRLADEGPIADLTPTKVTASQILATCWETYRNNLMHFFLLGLVLIAMQIGGQVISLPLGVLMGIFAEAESIVGIVVVQVINVVWSQLLGTFCAAVAVRYCLSVTAGSREPMKGAFDVFPIFVRLFFAQILVTLLIYAAALAAFAPFFLVMWLYNEGVVLVISAIGLGIVALLITIFIWTRLLLTFAFIIDRDQRIVDSMSSSIAYTKGNSSAIFLAYLAIVVLAVLFIIFTCFIGAVLAWPYLMMSLIVIYRLVTGQSINGENPFGSPTPITDEPGNTMN